MLSCVDDYVLICPDACGPPPEGAGIVNLRHVIMSHRDRFVNDDPQNRSHWLREGRRALRRYLKLLCFAIYLRLTNMIFGLAGYWVRIPPQSPIDFSRYCDS